MNHRLCLLVGVLFAAASVWVHGQPPSTKTRFQFKEPSSKAYLFETSTAASLAGKKDQWLKGHKENYPENIVEVGSRLVLQVKSEKDLKRLLAGTSLEVARTI